MNRFVKVAAMTAVVAFQTIGCFAASEPTPLPTATPDLEAMIRAAIATARNKTASPTLTPTARLTSLPTLTPMATPALLATLKPTATPTLRPNVGAIAVVHAGSCWSQGESFTEVMDDDGNTHAVEPFQILYLEGGEHIWLCGVLKSDMPPARVQGQITTFGYSEHGHSQGFYLPSGDPVYVNPMDLSQKYWTLSPAEWLYE